MTESDKTQMRWMVFFAILCFAIGAACWVVESHFESEAFNRLTGGNATTWDALWTELRVQGTPQK